MSASFHLLTQAGLFYPDVTNALREGRVLGGPTLFPVSPPAHPLILDLICVIFPPHLRMLALVAMQQTGLVVGVWCVLRILESANRPVAAVAGASIVALYFPLYALAQTTQTEPLFVAVSLVAAWLLTEAWRREASITWSLLAGVAIGVAMAIRTVGAALVPAVVVAIALGRGADKRRLAGGLAAGILLVIGVFITSNRLYHGYPGLVAGRGIHLFGRLAVVDKWLADSADARRLLEVARGQGINDVLIPDAGWRLHSVLAWRAGMGPIAADALLENVVMESWRARPIETASNTLQAMATITANSRGTDFVTLGGLRPEGFDAHLRVAEEVWANDLPTLRRLREQFPPYPGAEWSRTWSYSVARYGAGWASLLRGPWVIPLLVVAFSAGLWRRHHVLLLTSGAALCQLVASALGDAPSTRKWYTAVPFFVMAALLALSEVVDMFRGTRRAGS